MMQSDTKQDTTTTASQCATASCCGDRTTYGVEEKTRDDGQDRSLRGLLDRARALHATDPGTFWQRALFWTFWFHLAFFALGYGFREVMPLVSLICLVQYYRYNWRESVFCSLAIKPLFYCLWIMMFVGVAFSINPWESFLDTGTSFNKGLILPFLGMEAVRSLQDLKRLSWAALISFLWVGINGIWQAWTGHDILMGYTLHHGRLTAAIGDYCVGNYLAQVFVPAAGVWFILREKYAALCASLLFGLLAAPGLFTLYGSHTRAALFALVVSGFVWVVMLRFRHWKKSIVLTVLAMVLVYLGYQHMAGRMSLAVISEDGRWNLWYLGWEVVKNWPIFGAGADMYNTAFRALGLVPLKDSLTISHPHNLYLDILVSTGIVGAIFGYTFLFGMLVWLARKLWPRVACRWVPKKNSSRPGGSRLYWRLTGLWALAYCTWLVNGVFGHEFYRMWWLAQAMLSLGVAIGAIELALKKKTARQPIEAAHDRQGTAGQGDPS